MLAGETFKKDIFVEWKNNNWNFDLWNMYGPTEATVYATAFKLSKDADYPSSIPIGRVLEDVTYFIDKKDDRGIGELVLGGKGISGGYINNDDENNKKFININNKRYYRTGDLFSEDKHGVLYFHGRNDDQVQLNGIRVELGEIESRILGISEVVEAVVLYNQKKLIAFIQVRNNIDLQPKLVEILPR
ncbi:AMP-binding protein, partial [Enterococcus cecorum]